jgi:hypothetical protein
MSEHTDCLKAIIDATAEERERRQAEITILKDWLLESVREGGCPQCSTDPHLVGCSLAAMLEHP